MSGEAPGRGFGRLIEEDEPALPSNPADQFKILKHGLVGESSDDGEGASTNKRRTVSECQTVPSHPQPG